MTKLQRIGNLILGLLMVACGIVLLLEPQGGLLAMATLLGLTLVLYGVRQLVYYLRMARHMAGGLTVLFRAIIALDVGVFAVMVIDDPQLAIVLYLIASNVVMGLLSIARGIESKLFKSPWIASVVHGLVNLALAALCIAFVNSSEIIIWVLCISLFYNAGVRFVSAFKPAEIIYIQ